MAMTSSARLPQKTKTVARSTPRAFVVVRRLGVRLVRASITNNNMSESEGEPLQDLQEADTSSLQAHGVLRATQHPATHTFQDAICRQQGTHVGDLIPEEEAAQQEAARCRQDEMLANQDYLSIHSEWLASLPVVPPVTSPDRAASVGGASAAVWHARLTAERAARIAAVLGSAASGTGSPAGGGCSGAPPPEQRNEAAAETVEESTPEGGVEGGVEGDGATFGADASSEGSAAAADHVANQVGSNEEESIESTSPDRAATSHEPEAEAMDCPPAGLGGLAPKRKASGYMRRAKKAAKLALEEDGGYVNVARGKFRQAGGDLVTGSKRTCVPDALTHLLLGRGHTVEPEDVRTIMPADPDQNTKFEVANKYVARFGLRLDRVTKEFQVKGGSPYHLLLRTTGSFIIQLRVTTGNDDPNPDLHCVAFDGSYIKDNYKYTKVKEIEESDRTQENARLVFDSLFPGLEVRVKNVYELRFLNKV